MDLLPANIELSAMELSLVNIMSREYILKEYIDYVADFYETIIIDCMPSLGMITINALTCADTVVIPVQAAYLPVKGLEQLMMTIKKVSRQLNPKLKVEGILLTMVDTRTNYAKDIIRLCLFYPPVAAKTTSDYWSPPLRNDSDNVKIQGHPF